MIPQIRLTARDDPAKRPKNGRGTTSLVRPARVEPAQMPPRVKIAHRMPYTINLQVLSPGELVPSSLSSCTPSSGQNATPIIAPEISGTDRSRNGTRLPQRLRNRSELKLMIG